MSQLYNPLPIEKAYALHILHTHFVVPLPQEHHTSIQNTKIQLNGRDLVPFLTTSSLSRTTLRTIWSFVDPQSIGILYSPVQFCIILKCIALIQNGFLTTSKTTQNVDIETVDILQNAMNQFGKLDIPLATFDALSSNTLGNPPSPTYLMATYGSYWETSKYMMFNSTTNESSIQDEKDVFALMTDHNFQMKQWQRNHDQSLSNIGVGVNTKDHPMTISDAFGELVQINDAVLPSDDFGDFEDAPASSSSDSAIEDMSSPPSPPDNLINDNQNDETQFQHDVNATVNDVDVVPSDSKVQPAFDHQINQNKFDHDIDAKSDESFGNFEGSSQPLNENTITDSHYDISFDHYNNTSNKNNENVIQQLSISDAFGELVQVHDSVLPSDDFGDFEDAHDDMDKKSASYDDADADTDDGVLSTNEIEVTSTDSAPTSLCKQEKVNDSNLSSDIGDDQLQENEHSANNMGNLSPEDNKLNFHENEINPVIENDIEIELYNENDINCDSNDAPAVLQSDTKDSFSIHDLMDQKMDSNELLSPSIVNDATHESEDPWATLDNLVEADLSKAGLTSSMNLTWTLNMKEKATATVPISDAEQIAALHQQDEKEVIIDDKADDDEFGDFETSASNLIPSDNDGIHSLIFDPMASQKVLHDTADDGNDLFTLSSNFVMEDTLNELPSKVSEVNYEANGMDTGNNTSDDFGDFVTFDNHTIPTESPPPIPTEETLDFINPSPDAVVSVNKLESGGIFSDVTNTMNDDFGNFDQFSSTILPIEETTNEVSSSPHDQDFKDDFGDFKAFDEQTSDSDWVTSGFSSNSEEMIMEPSILDELRIELCNMPSLPKELQVKKSSTSSTPTSLIMFDKSFGTGDFSKMFPPLTEQQNTDPHGAEYRIKRAHRCLDLYKMISSTHRSHGSHWSRLITAAKEEMMIGSILFGEILYGTLTKSEIAELLNTGKLQTFVFGLSEYMRVIRSVIATIGDLQCVDLGIEFSREFMGHQQQSQSGGWISMPIIENALELEDLYLQIRSRARECGIDSFASNPLGTVSEIRSQAFQSGYTPPLCYLTLQPLDEDNNTVSGETTQPVVWKDKRFLSCAANFWANRISTQVP